MEICKDCGKKIYPIEAINDGDEILCVACARVRYPNEEALMTKEEIEVGHYIN